MEEEEELITIGTIGSRGELVIIKSVFADRDIWCFITDEHSAAVLPHNNIAMGDQRIQVRKSDEEVAVKLLEEIRTNQSQSVEEVWDDPEELEYFKEEETDQKASTRNNMVAIWIVAALLGLAIYFATQQ